MDDRIETPEASGTLPLEGKGYAMNSVKAAMAGVLMCVPFAAGAEAPVGLVLRASGPIVPAVSAFTEVAAEAVFTLGSGATIAILQYATCEQTVTEGGKVMVGAAKIAVEGGKTVTSPGRCPKQLAMQAGGQAAAVRLRGGAKAENVTVRPSCVLVGGASKSYRLARVMADSTVVAEFPLTGPQLIWPAAIAPLAAGEDYRLELEPGDAAAKPRSIEFTATPGDDQSLCLIRVD